MPPDVFAETLVSITKHKVRKYIIKIFPVEVSDKQFFRMIDHKNLEELLPFFFDPSDREKIVETIKKECPESMEQIITEADEICNHIFDLLGSEKAKLGEEIDRYLDFKSGFRWNLKTYYLWTGKYVTLDDDSDEKVPWELSKCQHFVTLGKAYWFTGNEKYAKEFGIQIDNWIDQNLLELGVNWACMMDVAIRAINWIVAVNIFGDIFNSMRNSNSPQLASINRKI